LVERGIEVDRALIVYQDSTGLWDQLRTRRSEFAGVRALGARDRIEAIQRARR